MIGLILTAVLAQLSPTNTGAQNSDAWDALMAATSTTGSRRIELKPGTYQFARQMDVIRHIELIGIGGGPNLPAVKFVFPAGSHGIYLHGATTFDGSGTNRADSSRVYNIWVTASGQTTVKHGVLVRAPVSVEALFVDQFTGDGINLHASLPAASASLSFIRNNWLANNGVIRAVTSAVLDGADLVVNTTAAHNLTVGDIVWLHRGMIEPNPWPQQRTVAQVNSSTEFVVEDWTLDLLGAPWAYFTPTSVRTGNGAFSQGGDSSAMRFEGNTYINNAAWGMYDASFLGNSHLGELADSNKIGAYMSPQTTSPSVWIGCYSEASNPQSFLRNPSVVIGGDHGAPLRGDSIRITGNTYDNMLVNERLADGTLTGGQVRVGSQDNNPTLLQFYTAGNAFPYNWIWDYAAAQLGGWDNTLALFNYSFLGGAGALVTTPSTSFPNGRTATNSTSGQMAFPNGYFLGRGSRVTEALAVPSAGIWRRGDIVFNADAAVSSPAGWVCTVSGDFDATPPTFVALFGPSGSNITAGTGQFTGRVQLDEAAKFPTALANPSHTEGLVFYDSSAGKKTLAYYNDEAAIVMNIGQEEWIPVRNQSGSTVTDGQALRFSGGASGLPLVALAQADASTTSDVVCVATHSIENNTNGYCTAFGRVSGLDTSAFTAGDVLYLSPSVAGGLTNTRPSVPNAVVRVAVVTNSNASTGSIHVFPGTRSGAAVQATIDFGSISANSCAENTATLTGAAANDTVECGWPAGLAANLGALCRVSATNTIAWRLCNPSGSPVDPASGVFTARVSR